MEQSDFDLLIKKNGSKNLGWRTDHLSYDRKHIENALSKHWVKENKKIAGINFGQGILQDLFFERIGHPLSVLTYNRLFLKITNRDRLITATVIQWLGTNVGFCWLSEALSKAGYDIVKRKDVVFKQQCAQAEPQPNDGKAYINSFSWANRYSNTDEPDKRGRWGRICYYKGKRIAWVSRVDNIDYGRYYRIIDYFPSLQNENPCLISVEREKDFETIKKEVEQRFTEFLQAVC